MSDDLTTTDALKEQVIEQLKMVFDPEIPVNIYDLGLIYLIEADEATRDVRIQMTLTSPACPVAQTFPQTVQDQILRIPHIHRVSVELVWDPPWTKDRMSDIAKIELNLF